MQTDPNNQAGPAPARDVRTADDLHREWCLAVDHARAAIEHARYLYGELKAQLTAQLAAGVRAATETRAAVRDRLAGRRIAITPDTIAQTIGAVLGAVDAEPVPTVSLGDALAALDALAQLPGFDLVAGLGDAFTGAASRAAR